MARRAPLGLEWIASVPPRESTRSFSMTGPSCRAFRVSWSKSPWKGKPRPSSMTTMSTPPSRAASVTRTAEAPACRAAFASASCTRWQMSYARWSAVPIAGEAYALLGRGGLPQPAREQQVIQGLGEVAAHDLTQHEIVGDETALVQNEQAPVHGFAAHAQRQHRLHCEPRHERGMNRRAAPRVRPAGRGLQHGGHGPSGVKAEEVYSMERLGDQRVER